MNSTLTNPENPSSTFSKLEELKSRVKFINPLGQNNIVPFTSFQQPKYGSVIPNISSNGLQFNHSENGNVATVAPQPVAEIKTQMPIVSQVIPSQTIPVKKNEPNLKNFIFSLVQYSKGKGNAARGANLAEAELNKLLKR